MGERGGRKETPRGTVMMEGKDQKQVKERRSRRMKRGKGRIAGGKGGDEKT